MIQDRTHSGNNSHTKMLIGNVGGVPVDIAKGNVAPASVTVANVSWSTAQTLFGGSTMLFNGSTSVLTLPDSVNWNWTVGKGVDLWLYPTDATVQYDTFVEQWAGASSYWAIYSHFANGFNFYFNQVGGSDISMVGPAPNMNAWNHLYVCREDVASWRMYHSGVSVAVASIAVADTDIAGSLRIGYGLDSNQWYKGHMANVRITDNLLWRKRFTLPSRLS